MVFLCVLRNKACPGAIIFHAKLTFSRKVGIQKPTSGQLSYMVCAATSSKLTHLLALLVADLRSNLIFVVEFIDESTFLHERMVMAAVGASCWNCLPVGRPV